MTDGCWDLEALSLPPSPHLRVLLTSCCWYFSLASRSRWLSILPVTGSVPKGRRNRRMWGSGLHHTTRTTEQRGHAPHTYDAIDAAFTMCQVYEGGARSPAPPHPTKHPPHL